jgi:hypothetical protein
LDSEKFDKVVLDLLYDELDELTRAAALRHIESSARARHIYSELRATREVGAVPLVEPPDYLTDRILDAERVARADRSLRSRIGSAVSIMAGYAMRPQLAMAALLMLLIGSSLIFLRARPGAHDSIQVTERGVPESESESVALVPTDKLAGPEGRSEPQAHGVLRSAQEEEATRRAEAREKRASAPEEREPVAAARPGDLADETARGTGLGRDDDALGAKKAKDDESQGSSGTPFSNAMLAYREGRFEEARERFDEVAASSDPNAATAALFSARAVERSKGCVEAADHYESVARRYNGAPIAYEARWAAAECHRKEGDLDKARSGYGELLASADSDYSNKARRALAELDQAAEVATRGRSSAKAAPPASEPAAKPSRPAAAAPPPEKETP